MSFAESKEFFDRIKASFVCPECREDPPKIVEEFSSGDIVCGSCGYVIGDIIDTRTEWRTFSGDVDTNKANPDRAGRGYDPLLAGEGLHTMIGNGKGNASAVRQLSKLQKQVTRVGENDRLRVGFTKIDDYCASGELSPTVVENAKQLLSNAYKAGIIHNFEDEWIYSVIYHACKRTKTHASMKDIATLHGGPAKNFTRQYHRLQKFMLAKSMTMVTEAAGKGEDVDTAIASYGGSLSIGAKDFLPKLCSQVGFPHWAATLGIAIVEAISDSLLLAARAGPNVATSVLYILSHLIGMPRPLPELYPLSKLGLVTIQKSVKILSRGKDELLANRFWPKDPRIMTEHFVNILKPEWYNMSREERKRQRGEKETEKEPKEEPKEKRIKTEHGGTKSASSSRPTSSSASSAESLGGVASPTLCGPGSDDGTATTDVTNPKKKIVGIGLHRYQTSKAIVFHGLYLPGYSKPKDSPLPQNHPPQKSPDIVASKSSAKPRVSKNAPPYKVASGPLTPNIPRGSTNGLGS